MVVQVEPPFADLSIMYPVIGEPPLSVGGDQPNVICEEDTVVAASPVGADGATVVVAETVFEGEPVPTELIAETL